MSRSNAIGSSQFSVVFPLFDSSQRVADDRRHGQYYPGQIERHVVGSSPVFEQPCAHIKGRGISHRDLTTKLDLY